MMKRRWIADILPIGAHGGLQAMAQASPIELGARSDVDVADVRLRPSQREIAGPAGTVGLEPRVLQLLLALADGLGGVLARDRLLALCWGDAVVGEDALNRAVAGARRALRDAGSTRLSIVTIPRVGYRLQDDGAATPPGTEEAAVPPAAGRPRLGRRVLLAGGLAVALLGAGGAVVAWRRRADPAASTVATLIGEADQTMRAAVPAADRQGIDLLHRAVELAPDDPRPWGRLALATRTAAEYAGPDALASLLAESQAAADRALALDPRNPDARVALATRLPVYGNWQPREQALQAVLADHPEHPPALDALSIVWASVGLASAHYPLRLRTVALDPLHAAYNFRSIYAHWMNDRLADADRAGARGLELWPRHPETWLARTGVFALTGRADRAVAMFDDAATRPALPPPLLASMRRGYAALADGSPAVRAAGVEAQLADVATGGPLVAVTSALVLGALGAVDRALDVVEAYLLERGPVMAGTAWRPGQALHYDVRRRLTQFLFLPSMAAVRAHPRFAAIMRDSGIAAYWRASGHRPDYLAGAPLP
jgi:DNA-binding winged helix-turn-helix (wHTH) protein/tetratricopeptide (TPR) repeat protein